MKKIPRWLRATLPSFSFIDISLSNLKIEQSVLFSHQ